MHLECPAIRLRRAGIYSGLVFLLFGAATTPAFCQSTRFEDGKSLQVSGETAFLKLKSLLADGKPASAARLIVELADRGPEGIYPVPSSSTGTIGSRRFVNRRFVNRWERINYEMAQWSGKHPEALRKYRSLVDTEADALYRRAMDRGDFNLLGTVATRYFLSSSGDEATDRIAWNEFEQGHFFVAAAAWDSLVFDRDYPRRVEVAYPDTDLPAGELILRSAKSSFLGGDSQSARMKLEYLISKEPDRSWTFLGRTLTGTDDLEAELEKLESEYRPRLLPPTLIDFGGRPDWAADTPSFSLENSPAYRKAPVIASGMERGLPVFPAIDSGSAYWRDEHRVFRMPIGRPAEQPDRIWETLFPVDKRKNDRKLLGRPVWDLAVQDGYLFARMGDSRTGFRNDTMKRSRSYLIGLDVRGGGSRVLPGFPIVNDDPRTEFDSTPVYRQGRLYVVTRKTYRDNAMYQLAVRALGLSPSNRARTAKLYWETDWGTAESNNRGLWDEISKSALRIFENRVIVVGMGFVCCLDRETGVIRWITEYPRDRFHFRYSAIGNAAQDDPGNPTGDPARSTAGSVGAGRRSPRNESWGGRVRIQDQVIHDRGTLYAMPADSRQLIALDLVSGKVRWQASFDAAVHLLGTVDGRVLISGHHLLWIEGESGRVVARFPSKSPRGHVGFGLDSTRGYGRGAIWRGIVFWPTRDQLFEFDAKLAPGNRIELRKIHQLRDWQSTGGNLCVGDGIMLIAGPQRIQAFEDPTLR